MPACGIFLTPCGIYTSRLFNKAQEIRLETAGTEIGKERVTK
jgi:hypothetical protein